MQSAVVEKTPVMTKSGLHMFLKSLPKEAVSPKLLDIAEQNMARFIAEDASNIANGGAKAASSALQQPQVQAQDASPMQVLDMYTNDVLLRHLS